MEDGSPKSPILELGLPVELYALKVKILQSLSPFSGFEEITSMHPPRKWGHGSGWEAGRNWCFYCNILDVFFPNQKNLDTFLLLGKISFGAFLLSNIATKYKIFFFMEIPFPL